MHSPTMGRTLVPPIVRIPRSIINTHGVGRIYLQDGEVMKDNGITLRDHSAFMHCIGWLDGQLIEHDPPDALAFVERNFEALSDKDPTGLLRDYRDMLPGIMQFLGWGERIGKPGGRWRPGIDRKPLLQVLRDNAGS